MRLCARAQLPVPAEVPVRGVDCRRWRGLVSAYSPAGARATKAPLVNLRLHTLLPCFTQPHHLSNISSSDQNTTAIDIPSTPQNAPIHMHRLALAHPPQPSDGQLPLLRPNVPRPTAAAATASKRAQRLKRVSRALRQLYVSFPSFLSFLYPFPSTKTCILGGKKVVG